MDPLNPEPPETYTFCKCGKRGCPALRRAGDSVVIEAPFAEIVTTETSSGVVFSPEQATELRQLLEKLGF